MKNLRLILSGIVLAALCLAVAPVTAAPTFTGDVETDFTGAGVLTILDPGGLGDVGLPIGAPGGTISGWDMIDFRLAYDSGTDTLYVGLNTSEIGGDADGDGDPSGTSAWLATDGGTDIADLGSTESFAVAFDLDQDGTYDVIAGVSGSTDISGFSVSNYTGVLGNWAFNFGTALPANTGSVYANPSASDPDLEFTILNFSTLPGQDSLLAGFKVHAFMGSLQDGGIGEDNIEYEQSPSTITTITSSADTVISGGDVDLFVNEENDGDANLYNPQVVVNDGSIDIAILTAPPDSGDTNGDGVLDPGETWHWQISSVVITSATTFTATGSGTDATGFVVTYPDDMYEQDAVTVEVTGGNEGCTPGFWKNNADKHGASAWVCYSPTDDFSDVFGIPEQELRDKGKAVFSDPTLLEALNARGGGINALARHATAALLNASSGCVEYPMSVADIIAAVQDAVAMDGDAIQALHSQLAMYNEAGCPINQHGVCSHEVDD